MLILRKITITVFLLFAILATTISHSQSYFRDSITQNYLLSSENLPPILITEVYYDSGKGCFYDYLFEWVEIYNTTNESIDLQGYLVRNRKKRSAWYINDSVILLPQDYLVIADPNTRMHLVFQMADPEKIFPASAGGLRLDNDGDKIEIYDPEENVIDAMSYGTNNSVFDPPCPDVLATTSLERNAVNVDTNTNQDFVVQINPSPTEVFR